MIRIILSIIFSLFMWLNITSAATNVVWIDMYMKSLNEIIKSKDIDFNNISLVNVTKWYDLENSFNSNYIVVSPSEISIKLFEDKYNNNPIFITEFWNNNTGKIANQIDTCDSTVKKIKYIEKFIGGNRYLNNMWLWIKLSQSEVLDIFACYVKYNSFTHSEIKTTKASYRIHNIWTALGLFNNTIWNTGSTLSLYNTIFGSDAKYKEWLWIRINAKGKVEEFPTYGGWVCWVSTIFYQNSLKTYSVDVTSRRNHSNYYKSYYGNVVWLDATIYWEGGKAWTDLTLVNNTNTNIIIKTYSYTTKSNLIYWVYYYAPFIGKNTVSQKSTKDKKWCYINSITLADWTQKTTRSCYVWVY